MLEISLNVDHSFPGCEHQNTLFTEPYIIRSRCMVFAVICEIYFFTGDNYPEWKLESDVQYTLNDESCAIRITSFCWIKVEVDEELVEAKKIQVFAKIPELIRTDNASQFIIGFYWDLPEYREVCTEAPKHKSIGKRDFHRFILIKTMVDKLEIVACTGTLQ